MAVNRVICSYTLGALHEENYSIGITSVLLSYVVDAVSDEDIRQFADGVLAGRSLLNYPKAEIGNNTLMLKCKLSEYSEGKIGLLGFDIWEMSKAAEDIVDRYPGRFSEAELQLYNPDGDVIVARMFSLVR